MNTFDSLEIRKFDPADPAVEPGCAYRLSLNWDDYYGDDPVASSAIEWIIAIGIGRFLSEKNFFNRVWRQFRDKFEPEEYYEIFFEAEGLENLRSLVIGNWHLEREDETVAIILERLIKNAERLPNLRSIFIGDILEADGSLESLRMDDFSPFLAAFPLLEVLHIRGGSGLSFKNLSHPNLRELVIETTADAEKLSQEIQAGNLPNLKHLEIK